MSPMSHQKTGEAMSHQHGRRRTGLHGNIQRTNPILAYRTVPISQIHALPLGMAQLPERLPMLRPGVANTGQDYNRSVHLHAGPSLVGCAKLLWYARTSMVWAWATQQNTLVGCSKSPDFSPAQPLRAETRLVPGKAVASNQRLSFQASSFTLSNDGPDESPTARNGLTLPPTGTFETCHAPERGSSGSPNLNLREWPRLPFTARIERAPFHRARSASKKGTWPLPPYPSQAARCASTGDSPDHPLC